MVSIDLNCDLGEGGRRDEDVVPLISSCNACSGHYRCIIRNVAIDTGKGRLIILMKDSQVTRGYQNSTTHRKKYDSSCTKKIRR